MPRAEICPAFLLDCELHPVSLKGILFILFASFANPHSTHLSPVTVHETMSGVNEELRPRLKPCDCKRQRLDFAIPSRTSLGALRSIRDEAVQRVQKNIRQMIESFLHMPDNEADAPAWC